MSLEDEIKQELWDVLRRDASALEAGVSGVETSVSLEDVVAILTRRIAHHQAVILRLAREIDGLRS